MSLRGLNNNNGGSLHNDFYTEQEMKNYYADDNGYSNDHEGFTEKDFLTVVLGILAVICFIITLCFLREFFWWKFGINCCPAEAAVALPAKLFPKSLNAASISSLLDQNSSASSDSIQSGEEAFARLEERRRERRAWYTVYLEKYTKTLTHEDFIMVEGSDSAKKDLINDDMTNPDDSRLYHSNDFDNIHAQQGSTSAFPSRMAIPDCVRNVPDVYKEIPEEFTYSGWVEDLKVLETNCNNGHMVAAVELAKMMSMKQRAHARQKFVSDTQNYKDQRRKSKSSKRLLQLFITKDSTSSNRNDPSSNNQSTARRVTCEANCSICNTDYCVGEKIVWSSYLDECQHVFHEECLLVRLCKGKKRCPICNNWFVPGTSIETQMKTYFGSNSNMDYNPNHANDSSDEDEQQQQHAPTGSTEALLSPSRQEPRKSAILPAPPLPTPRSKSRTVPRID